MNKYREYIVSYEVGTSPYRYTFSTWATSPAEALQAFQISQYTPHNARSIKVIAL